MLSTPLLLASFSWASLPGILIPIFICMAVYDCYDAHRLGKRRFKPFLMPTLALIYVLVSKQVGHPVKVALVVGLLFGACGDYFLIKKDEKSFLKGLISFFVNHVFYLVILFKEVDFSKLSQIDGWILVAYGLVVILVLRKLYPHIPKHMKVPVFAYMSVLLGMSIFAFYTHTTMCKTGFLWTWIGSLFFITSDTILAFETFAGGSHEGVMPTYVLAQVFIVIGHLFA